jgi:hypothetical protein
MKKQIGKILSAIGLKKKVLQCYFFINQRWHQHIKLLRIKIVPLFVSSRSKNGVYAIYLNSDWLGLGARIVKTLEILLHCEKHQLIPVIKYGYKEQDAKQVDYFNELFFNKVATSEQVLSAKYTDIRDVDELGWTVNYNLSLKLATAGSLFDKYLGFNPDIIEEVEDFSVKHFKNKKVLGVHYRGTDKMGEAPLVGEQTLYYHISYLLQEHADFEIIFISTDDEKIIHFLHHSDLPVPVIFRQDAVRSADGDQFHRKKQVSKSIVHRDAVVNMLLLSRTDFLLKTASILSDCSVIFNPSLPLRVISFPHSDNLTWWPATEIKQKQEQNSYAVAENR